VEEVLRGGGVYNVSKIKNPKIEGDYSDEKKMREDIMKMWREFAIRI
jgi:hypothetical protein